MAKPARRGLEIHFPRYHGHVEPDGQAFRNVLLTLLTQVPLTVDRAGSPPTLAVFLCAQSSAVWGYSKSGWSARLALALRDGSDTLNPRPPRAAAFSEAKCARMAADIQVVISAKSEQILGSRMSNKCDA